MEFWSDHHAFQVRWRPGSGPRSDAVPIDALTPESLLRGAYQSTLILCWRPESQHRLWLWTGATSNGTGTIVLSNKSAAQEVTNLEYPPLTADDEKWGARASWNTIDEFFAAPVSDFHVSGVDWVQGRQIPVLARLRRTSLPSGEYAGPGEVEVVQLVKAWIDPDQGCLPIRMEWRSGYMHNGSVLGEIEKDSPFRVLDGVQVAHVGKGFYPSRGTVTLYTIDPDSNEHLLSVEDAISGKVQHLRMVPFQTETWNASTVDLQPRMPTQLWAMDLPDSIGLPDDTTAHPEGGPLVGESAPEFDVAGWTDGQTRRLSGYRGKPVFLDFWGVWCAPCVHSLPELEELGRTYAGRVVFLGIHTPGVEMERVRRVLSNAGVTIPSAVDAGDSDNGHTLARFKINEFPSWVLIGRDGKVAWTSEGMTLSPQWAETAKRLGIDLSKQPSPEDLARLHVANASARIDAAIGSP